MANQNLSLAMKGNQNARQYGGNDYPMETRGGPVEYDSDENEEDELAQQIEEAIDYMYENKPTIIQRFREEYRKWKGRLGYQ